MSLDMMEGKGCCFRTVSWRDGPSLSSHHSFEHLFLQAILAFCTVERDDLSLSLTWPPRGLGSDLKWVILLFSLLSFFFYLRQQPPLCGPCAVCIVPCQVEHCVASNDTTDGKEDIMMMNGRFVAAK